MRSTWSWACRTRDRCPRSVTYTPGYPAAEVGPSLPEDLPRRPPVVPDGNNHRAHSSAGNQIRCPFRFFAIFLFVTLYHARARARVHTECSLSFSHFCRDFPIPLFSVVVYFLGLPRTRCDRPIDDLFQRTRRRYLAVSHPRGSRYLLECRLITPTGERSASLFRISQG